jgi:8-hydroxy-5-deazaflavin:NADPH oxidoreductase
MKIGVIGVGAIGSAIVGHLARAGHDLLLANRRGPDGIAEVLRTAGPRASAVSREEAAAAELVILAVPWEQVPGALAGLPNWEGRILIDATNPVVQPGFRLAELGGRASTEVVASLAPGAQVVKAGNTLLAAVLASDPRQAGGNRVLFLCGDDVEGKTVATRLLGELGFATVDLGTLAAGARLQQFPGGSLPTLNLVKLP